jgi:hypothetical protein
LKILDREKQTGGNCKNKMGRMRVRVGPFAVLSPHWMISWNSGGLAGGEGQNAHRRMFVEGVNAGGVRLEVALKVVFCSTWIIS